MTTKEGIEIDFGTRTISKINTSRMVALPHEALSNLSNAKMDEMQKVNVQLVQDKDGDRYIKLSPLSEAEIVAQGVKARAGRRK